MHCIENEFEQCLESIRSQTNIHWELFTIENLPNKQAHDTLYSTFMERAKGFDFFIKIDADMVLSRPTFFDEVIDAMNKNIDYDHFQIGVFDHFTDHIIYALHVYRNSVKWQKTNEAYFVDMVNEPTKTKTYIKEDAPLVPAADHCPNPSDFQSFHFGLHKVSKVLQMNASLFKTTYSKLHLETIRRVFELNRNHFCMLGIIWAFEQKITSEEIDFSNNKVLMGFMEFENLSHQKRRKLIDNWIKKNPFKLTNQKIWTEFVFLRIVKNQSYWKSAFYSFTKLYKEFFLSILHHFRSFGVTMF